MAYAALSAFLTEPIAQREDIPDSEKTPEYWAERLGREWYGLPAEDVAAKLLPFFREFNRFCEGEKAEAARIKALETALNRCFVGGNHIAGVLIDRLGARFSSDYPPGSDHGEVRAALTSQEDYEIWCCWNALMCARTAAEADSATRVAGRSE